MSQVNNVYICSDHGGYELKEQIKPWLEGLGYQVEDMGPFSFDPGDDYPDYVLPLAQKVQTDKNSFGIILGRSGNGEVIAANKVKGIRAVLCLNDKMAEMAKVHNNANILSLGADYLNFNQVKSIVQTFLQTPFPKEERHVRRLQKVADFEQSH